MKRGFILSAIIILLGSSCADEILDVKPLDALTPDQAFASAANLEMYINSLYEMSLTFPTAQRIYGTPANSGYNKWPFTGENMSDLTSNANYVEEYITPGAYRADLEEFWTWSELRRINYFLDNYQKSEAPEAVKRHYAGIARCVRAKFYFDKVKMFGDVPWYGSTISSDDEDQLYKARDPRTMVMDSVLADLDYAIENISDKKDHTSTTITKWVALGYKSRICLFEGTFRKYHPELGLSNTAEFWLREAVDAAQQIMNSGQYAIYNTGKPESDYHELFISDNAVSTEVMLASAYSEALLTFHSSTNFYSNVGGRYLMSLIKRFINTYLNIDGTRFTDTPGYDTIFFTRECSNRDLRLSQTIRTPSYIRTDGSSPPPDGANSSTLYHPIKWSHPDPFYDNGRSVNDISLMRYAEILLNYAEAKAELGEFTASDWNNTIALLRQRAGITDTSMPTTIDPYLKENFYNDIESVAILEIRRERAIELILEKFRYYDLIRWKEADNMEKETDGIYVPAMNELYDLNGDGEPDISFVSSEPAHPVPGVYYKVIDGNGYKLSEGNKGKLIAKPNQVKEFPDFKYFKPIPSLELQLNSNLEQNEGWD
jgi:hypothetical protein